MDLTRAEMLKTMFSGNSSFDTVFTVAVKTTGIYCRPSCNPPRKPKPENIQFFKTARGLLRGLNPLAHVTESQNASVDAPAMLEQNAFEPDWKPRNYTHEHVAGVSSFTLHHSEALDVIAWNTFMEEFIISRPGSVFRAKGFLAFKQIADEIVFQAVREIVKVTKTEQRHEGQSNLVVIGRGLDETEYREAFAKLHVPLQARFR